MKVWDESQPLLVDTITVGPAVGKVYKVVFSPSGRHLATINANGNIFLLRLADPQSP